MRRSKGEIAESGRAWKASLWRLDSDEAIDSPIIEPHLTWLLERLEPQAEALVDLVGRDDIEGYADVFWASPGRSGGPWIQPSTMARLAALHLPLVVSFYTTD